MSLLRTAARASIATRVIGSTHRRQQQRWAAQDAAAAQSAVPAAAPVAPTTPAPAGVSVLDQLTQLGQLRDAGVLTEAEFEAQKQRILASA
ncbi:MAG: SHOCT domain-containing protein [Arthrobacter sp.]|jgi:hypothetical protein|nr:SHOCT domain-containing protein [Arthrobacter sp.]